MLRSARALGVLVLAMVLAFPAHAEQTGAEATPPVALDLAGLDPGMPEGAVETAAVDRPFDRYALPVGPFEADAPRVRVLRGRVIRRAFRLDDPQATTAAVAELYRRRLAELGYEIVLDCIAEGCGGLAFRFAAELLPPPAMLMDAADFVQLSGLKPLAEGGEAALSVLVSRALEAVYVQLVLVLPGEPGLRLVPSQGLARALAPPSDAETLYEEFRRFGHVILGGVEFVSGRAELDPASAPALDAAAAMLKAHPELSVIVVGHSDNVGGLEANIALSKKRAEAVRAALVERGVEAKRLGAEGVGYLAPIASNATEEGRALNRRVELVEN